MHAGGRDSTVLQGIFFLSFFPLFGPFVFAFLTIKNIFSLLTCFPLFMHTAGPLRLGEVL